MSSSMKATIHLGPNYLANLDVYKNTNVEEIQSLFNITQKLILEHSEEILNVHTSESASPSWKRSTLSHDQVIQWTVAKVRVYSDSALCMGRCHFKKDAITRWEGLLEEFKMSGSYKELCLSMENQLNSSGISSQDLRQWHLPGTANLLRYHVSSTPRLSSLTTGRDGHDILTCFAKS